MPMMPALSLFLLLGVFWALLSGQFHNSFLITQGCFASPSSCGCSHRMGVLDDEGVPARFYPRTLLYLPYLTWQVLLSNWDVFKRVWDPNPLPIDPRMSWVDYSTRHPFVTTTYANSITLTPGTVTVVVEERRMLIHCLTADAESGLKEGDMERHVKTLED
jgi:multicomponent Na+:H+ antiporter subunit E